MQSANFQIQYSWKLIFTWKKFILYFLSKNYSFYFNRRSSQFRLKIKKFFELDSFKNETLNKIVFYIFEIK